MIQCIDFVPEKKKGSLFKSGAIQDFEDVMKEMNDWIAANDANVISVETVVLPNIHDSEEEGSHDTELWTGGESSSKWYQLFRVWYKKS
ncbi:MAG: hypothetical protein AAGA85_06855 [Bacteroidota bacterium]